VEPTNGHALHVAIHFPRLASLPVIIERVRRIFDLPPDPDESTPIWPRIRRLPRSWQGGLGYAYQVHGTASSSPCGPCSANRLRFARRWAWQHSSDTVTV